MKKAFTIIELLIVISVLSVLIAIAIPRFKGMKDQGNMAKARAEVKSLQTAIESYKTFSTNNTYPSSSTQLVSSYLLNATPKVVSNNFYDPFGATSTTEYRYLSSSNGKYYIIWSVGLSGATQPTSISNTGDISF